MKDKLRELAELDEGACVPVNRPNLYAAGWNDCRAVVLAMIDAEGDGGAVEVCIPFGEGKVVVTTGTHGGMPCVFLAPASIPGVVGESAARENLPLDKRVPGESILTFPTVEQASIVANTLCGKNTHPARSGVVSNEDVTTACRKYYNCGHPVYPPVFEGMRAALESYERNRK